MSIYVAYNMHGDLISEASSYAGIIQQVEWLGYDLDDVLIGKVTP